MLTATDAQAEAWERVNAFTLFQMISLKPVHWRKERSREKDRTVPAICKLCYRKFLHTPMTSLAALIGSS
jgi:hypothetical protein